MIFRDSVNFCGLPRFVLCHLYLFLLLFESFLLPRGDWKHYLESTSKFEVLDYFPVFLAVEQIIPLSSLSCFGTLFPLVVVLYQTCLVWYSRHFSVGLPCMITKS